MPSRLHTTRYRRPGLKVAEHTLTVPLIHGEIDGEQIEVFARELVAADARAEDLPWLLWLQGGPGGRADRPSSVSGWLKRALTEFRVLLLDQRGTGRSTPATRQTLPLRGDPAAQAEYLSHFRADAIVADAELLRAQLAGEDTVWSVLGQSFGGFCALTYLSRAPHGLAEVLITGGLPPLHGGPEAVYQATYPKVAARSAYYFSRYPDDEANVRRIVKHLEDTEELLPTGERLTPHRLQTLGLGLGRELGLDTLHYLLEDPFVPTRYGPRLSDTFLTGAGAQLSFAERPLYALLHEPIYCQHEAASWSAHRVRKEFADQFDPLTDGAFRFTGEMIYPWQFQEDPALAPLAETAQLLADKDDWPALYDEQALVNNEVPVAAAIYLDDMFVAYEHSAATAHRVRGLRPWVTNAYQHDGIRVDGPAVVDRLLGMVRGRW
jgi:pimeloyl-ACP methyl ester carboxylesterase